MTERIVIATTSQVEMTRHEFPVRTAEEEKLVNDQCAGVF
jgi:hypothetical protein